MPANLYEALSQINKIRRKQSFLPITNQTVVVSPLSVGDDLILRTGVTSPVNFDKELLKLLWLHTEFWIPTPQEPEEEEEKPTETNGDIKMPPAKKKKKSKGDGTGGYYKKLKEDEFYQNISYIDKIMLLWTIYQTTYVTLGEHDVTCPSCKKIFKREIIVDETLHDDSLTPFDHDVPFNKYSEIINIDYGEYILEFTVGIPSMADFNRMLGLVPMEEIQYNLEHIRSNFNTEQLLALYTKKLAVYAKDKPTERIESKVTQEILASIRDCVNIDIAKQFAEEYHKRFGKYNVVFYDLCECPYCKHKDIRTEVDIEYYFFLKQLSN